jgi:hypothetical protein
MATPNWLGATTAQAAQAGQVNQFLGTHAASFLYAGASFSSQGTAGSGAVNSNSLWIAQQFTTGTATAIGRAQLTLAVTGTPTALPLAVYANTSGAPSGGALVTTAIPSQYLTGSATAVSIPLPDTLSASTTYWLVTQAVGDASDFYSWSKSNQTSGASTSTNGTSWSAQTYGLLYTCFDKSAVSPLTHTWEDSGARWTTQTVNSNGSTNSWQEYTVAQGTSQYVYSKRTLVYAATLPPLPVSLG